MMLSVFACAGPFAGKEARIADHAVFRAHWGYVLDVAHARAPPAPQAVPGAPAAAPQAAAAADFQEFKRLHKIKLNCSA